MNASTETGAELTLLPRFDPAKALEIIQRDKVTIFQGVPTMYAAMLQVPGTGPITTSARSASAFRRCRPSGRDHPRLRGRIQHADPEGYGSRDFSGRLRSAGSTWERKAGTIGTPTRDVELRLVDEEGNVPRSRRCRVTSRSGSGT